MEEKMNASMAIENENSNAVNNELEVLREDKANLIAELENLKEEVKSLKSDLKSLKSDLKEAQDSNSSLNKWWLQERSKVQVLCIVAKAAADSDGSVVQLIDRIAKAI